MGLRASELRIGNFVNLYGDDCRIQTVGMWVHTDTTVDEAPIESVKPIPLTDEWLLKFGFEPNNMYMSMRLPLEPLRAYGTRTFIVIAHDGDAWIELIDKNRHRQYKELQSHAFKCQSVHQLQNLYFALTGEELTLNQEHNHDKSREG